MRVKQIAVVIAGLIFVLSCVGGIGASFSTQDYCDSWNASGSEVVPAGCE